MDRDSWGTPPEIINAVKWVFGGTIGLDPCSNRRAQQTVRSVVWLDGFGGLDYDWCTADTVFVNPPYSNPAPWVDKFIGEVRTGVMLVNACTDTVWCQKLLCQCDAVCFTRGRLAFLHPETGEPTKGNRMGQAIFLMTPRRSTMLVDMFEDRFSAFGTVIKLL